MSATDSGLNSKQDHVVILVNPHAGRRGVRGRVDRLEQLLSQQGFTVHLDTDLTQATQRATAWWSAGVLRALVGVGGDGTAAELVNRTPPGMPLTLLPAGSANLLARHLRLPGDPEQMAQLIAAGHLSDLDAARANGRIFLVMASAGFDAEVVGRLHAARSGHIRGWPTYVGHLVRALGGYRFPAIRVYWDQAQWSTRWCCAFNFPCYGGNFRFAPQADGGDGQLDVCGYDRGGFWPGVKLAAAAKLGQQHRLADWRAFRAVRLRLESDERVPYQLDGDPGGHLPLELEVLPGRLCLLTPAAAKEACHASA